jgi:arylsulfatase A
MPTVANAGGAKAPNGIDGKSLLPVFQGKGELRKKDYIYCWYQRNGERKKASQHTRTARYKLYATGAFFDVQSDPGEATNLGKNGIPEQLRATHAMLKIALSAHVADTKIADPIINAKRGAGKKKKAKKQ